MIVAAQIWLSFFPRRWSWKRRLLATLLAFPAVGGLEGLAMGLATGYWN